MNILIALVGKSPAVLTTTLYGLAKLPQPFVPNRVVVITTGEGAQLLREQLLDTSGNAKSKLNELVKHLSWSAPFVWLGNSPNLKICVPVNVATRTPDADTHLPDELDRMGDLIFEEVYKATRYTNSKVMLSLSGGRKTMAHLAGTVMTLLGRPGKDSLLHVLVKPAWVEDSSVNFFYPFDGMQLKEPETDALGSRKQEVLSKEIQVDVELTQVPFLYLAKLKEVAAEVNRSQGKNLSSVIASSNTTLDVSTKTPLLYDESTGGFTVGGSDFIPTKTPYFCTAVLRLLISSDTGVLNSPSLEHWRELLEYWREAIQKKGKQSTPQDKATWVLALSDVFPGALRGKTVNSTTHEALFISSSVDGFDERSSHGRTIAKAVTYLNQDLKKTLGAFRPPAEVGIKLNGQETPYRLGTALRKPS